MYIYIYISYIYIYNNPGQARSPGDIRPWQARRVAQTALARSAAARLSDGSLASRSGHLLLEVPTFVMSPIRWIFRTKLSSASRLRVKFAVSPLLFFRRERYTTRGYTCAYIYIYTHTWVYTYHMCLHIYISIDLSISLSLSIYIYIYIYIYTRHYH